MQLKKYCGIWICVLVLGWCTAEAVELIPDVESSYIRAELRASPPHSFMGEVKRYSLEMEAGETGLESARFAFQFADFDTDNDKRDKKMLKWMDVEAHPSVVYELERVEAGSDGPVAVGKLSMHASEQELRIPFNFDRDDKTFTLDASYTLDHRDWGLPKVRLLIFTVNPVMEIKIHIEGTYAAG
jgi:polyisoprenoid-binding protein YceI